MAAANYKIRERILSLPKKQETDVYHMELNGSAGLGKKKNWISGDGLMTMRR